MKGKTSLVVVLFVLSCIVGCRDSRAPSNKAEDALGPSPVTLRVGHVGHDHHTALFVALDRADEYEKETGLSLEMVEDQKRYTLFDGDRKVADLEIVQVGGGAKMPTALAQGVIDVGLGGVAAVLAARDSGAPVRLIAPLHSKGDMLVVRPDLPVKNWKEFVALVKSSPKPLRIGYKSPMAVAKLVFEDALRHEGIQFSGNPSQKDVQVYMINVKGGGKLNVSLSEGLVDGYVGNNPFPAIGVEKHIGKIVSDLEDLPPGRFRNHPCCCVAANIKAVEDKHEAVADLLALLLAANETINNDQDAAVQSACRWIGTSETVERASIPTSGYSLEPDAAWRECMRVWLAAMNDLGVFQGKLQGLEENEAASVAYDFSFLEEARKRRTKGSGQKP
ncbi:MAG: ABC transporter substrate-binding protein [Pirellulales bacterium]|nr:ABC transporter substrate-binding protein [Pirellulales bacterium]